VAQQAGVTAVLTVPRARLRWVSALAFPMARLRRRRRPPSWWRWIVALLALLFAELVLVLIALTVDPSPGLAILATGVAFLVHDTLRFAQALRGLEDGRVEEIEVRFWLVLPGGALAIAGIVVTILERV
jgi:hypothetical protein